MSELFHKNYKCEVWNFKLVNRWMFGGKNSSVLFVLRKLECYSMALNLLDRKWKFKPNKTSFLWFFGIVIYRHNFHVEIFNLSNFNFLLPSRRPKIQKSKKKHHIHICNVKNFNWIDDRNLSISMIQSYFKKPFILSSRQPNNRKSIKFIKIQLLGVQKSKLLLSKGFY